MKRRSTHAVAWVLLAVSAYLVWPKAWGGSMTYVITRGSSMAPAWEAGDLAVLRTADDYGVGDVVAYRSEELRQIVMHRVVEEDDGVLRTQGDSNDFVDPDRVGEDEVLGELFLRVPGVGRAWGWLVQPVNLVLLAAGLFLLYADRREKQRPAAPEPAADGPAPATPQPPLLVTVERVHMPASAVVADVVCAAELRELAARCGRPVLRDRTDRTLYVVDAVVVYRCRHVARRAVPAPVEVPQPRIGDDEGVVVHRLFGGG